MGVRRGVVLGLGVVTTFLLMAGLPVSVAEQPWDTVSYIAHCATNPPSCGANCIIDPLHCLPSPPKPPPL